MYTLKAKETKCLVRSVVLPVDNTAFDTILEESRDHAKDEHGTGEHAEEEEGEETDQKCHGRFAAPWEPDAEQGTLVI
jgi:hypothetical protein